MNRLRAAEGSTGVRKSSPQRRLPLIPVILFAASLACFCAAVTYYGTYSGLCAGTGVFALSDGSPSLDATAVRVTTPRLDTDGFPITADMLASTFPLDYALLDYRLLAFVSYPILMLYPLTLAAYVVVRCRQLRKRADTHPTLKAVSYGIPALAVITVTAALAASLEVFGSYLPTRWSDFPAWSDCFDQIVRGLSTLAVAAKTEVDLAILTPWATAIALLTLALILLIVALNRTGFWLFRTAAQHGKIG